MSATRAERRRAEKAARKAQKGQHHDPDQRITLQNPVAQHFGAFIVGNAQYCERVVEQDSAKGQHVVICGAGPSLADTAAEWCPKGDQVWGCNSAAIWLHQQGHKVTHAFTVDQTPAMVTEWRDAPPLEYLVASTIHPHLTDYLRSKDCRLTWFHNFVGIQQRPVRYGACDKCGAIFDEGTDGVPVQCQDVWEPPDAATCPHTKLTWRLESYEDWLYLALYPGTIRAGSGLNTATRAIDVALFMGFEQVTLLGADCSLKMTRPAPNAPQGSPEHLDWLRHDVIMHADGGGALSSGATPVTLRGTIDGREYLTKPDMAVSAVWLEVMRRKSGGRIQLIGDGYAQALKDKPKEFLARLPALVDSQGNPAPIEVDT